MFNQLNNKKMKHEVNLSAKGAVPATDFNGRWACTYGETGYEIKKHNYTTKTFARISVYDIYFKGEHVKTFDTKKSATEYVEECLINSKN